MAPYLETTPKNQISNLASGDRRPMIMTHESSMIVVTETNNSGAATAATSFMPTMIDQLKDMNIIDPTFLIGILVGLAVVAVSAIFLRPKGKAVVKSEPKKQSTPSKKRSTTSSVSTPSSPPRISRAAVGSVSTPAGRRSARLARKNAD